MYKWNKWGNKEVSLKHDIYIMKTEDRISEHVPKRLWGAALNITLDLAPGRGSATKTADEKYYTSVISRHHYNYSFLQGRNTPTHTCKG